MTSQRKSSNSAAAEGSFWDHADALRAVLIKGAVAVTLFTVVLFYFMPRIFDSVIMAPCRSDFPLYRFLGVESFSADIINIRLASQFFIHVSTSFWLAVVLSCPVLLYLLWTFVSPALYRSERSAVRMVFVGGNVMFYIGVALGYFLVFPLTLHFLADYHISEEVPNTISLDSYIDNFMMMMLAMGLVCELPVVAWLLGRLGILHRRLFNTFRRHAIVVLLFMAAVITPTGDPFTLMAVFVPLYLLWELAALLVPLRD